MIAYEMEKFENIINEKAKQLKENRYSKSIPLAAYYYDREKLAMMEAIFEILKNIDERLNKVEKKISLNMEPCNHCGSKENQRQQCIDCKSFNCEQDCTEDCTKCKQSICNDCKSWNEGDENMYCKSCLS